MCAENTPSLGLLDGLEWAPRHAIPVALAAAIINDLCRRAGRRPIPGAQWLLWDRDAPPTQEALSAVSRALAHTRLGEATLNAMQQTQIDDWAPERAVARFLAQLGALDEVSLWRNEGGERARLIDAWLGAWCKPEA